MTKLPITLYYRITLATDKNVSNAIQTTLLSTTTGYGIPAQSSNYSAVTVRLMMNKEGLPNNDVISFLGIRTPEDKLLGLQPLYNETVTIQTSLGLINGQAIYVDNGSGVTSTVLKVQYAVGANSGEFDGAKIITIYIDNVNFTREVVITF